MSPERTPELFDSWASNYDYWIAIGSDSFPFRGYDNVLNRIVQLANPRPGSQILDVGIGTGNLARRFVELDCEIWGIDYSARMLEEARKKVPNAHLVQLDVESRYPSELRVGFDCIVSAYTLHHLTLERKVTVVKRLADELLAEGGRIIVGDVSFPTISARAEARKKLASEWDDYEYYWAADEFNSMILGQGLYVVYEQISDYGGVYVVVPRT
ncbi:MAG: class I SAM-dependent methyltransferase [Candidatus Thorarchaeota archaeon]